MNQLLKNNLVYVDKVNKENPEFFKTLGSAHNPKYLLIGCVDARIQPNTLFSVPAGDLFIHRNIANQFFQGDLNCNAVVQYAIEGLKIRDIIVMGHSKCGGVNASMTKIPFQIVDQWITSIRDIYEHHQDVFQKLKTDEERSTLLAKLNVRQQCMNL